MSDLCLYLTLFVVYFFGCGLMFGYLLKTKRDIFANSDASVVIWSVVFWPLSMWCIIGGYLSEVWFE